MKGRPRSRTECLDGPRPCPWVSCRYHLLLDVTEDGRLYNNWQVDETSADSIADTLTAMPDTCSLDRSHEGLQQEEIGALFSLTKQRIEQIEARAIARLKAAGIDLEDAPEHPDDPYMKYFALDDDESAELVDLYGDYAAKARKVEDR